MTSLLRITLCSTALLLPARTYAVHALPPELSPSFYASAPEDDYGMGVHAMDEHRWPDAVTAFDKVINAKGDRVDAALYWKAYSLNKLGNTSLAMTTCKQLHAQFANSTWNRDCDTIALNADVQANGDKDKEKVKARADRSYVYVERADRGEEGVPRGSDEDLKLIALSAVLRRDPAAGIPALRGILSGNDPINVKKHALFVLAQSKTPEADAILRDAALGKLDPQLQSSAIQTMAVFQGAKANDTLAEVYRTTTDPKIKKSIINAMFITKDAPRMVEMAKNEKDLELKRQLVQQLALMNDPAATNYMMELLK
jgi:HEAT repeat protein